MQKHILFEKTGTPFTLVNCRISSFLVSLKIFATQPDRLARAIAQLEAEGRPVNTFTVKEVSGLDYMAYYRNAEALALFRTHSTHLRNEREKERAKRRRSRHKQSKQEEAIHEVQVEPRDRLLNYKKPELGAKLRAAQA